MAQRKILSCLKFSWTVNGSVIGTLPGPAQPAAVLQLSFSLGLVGGRYLIMQQPGVITCSAK